MYRVAPAPIRLGQVMAMRAATVVAFTPAVVVGAIALGGALWWLAAGRRRRA